VLGRPLSAILAAKLAKRLVEEAVDLVTSDGRDEALRKELAAIGPISADSHVTEPPTLYVDYIDPKFRDAAPRAMLQDGGDVYVLPGHEPINMGLVASAGRSPQDMGRKFNRYADLHPGGWDPKARIRAQEKDGVVGEVLYPTVGMIIYGLEDAGLMQACATAYTRWIAEYVAFDPTRLWGAGQTAVRSVAEAVADVVRMKELGLRGVYLPSAPLTDEDYDHPSFEPLWRTCEELKMPICFHVFTGGRRNRTFSVRGHSINLWNGVMRENQDLIGMFIFGGLFDRHPDLKLVCVEADAGWAPHFLSRMDHIYRRHGVWHKAPPLKRLPSEYFLEHVYLTFQDDWVAFRTIEMMNGERLMWANDFPHADSTWPNSMPLLEAQTACLTPQMRRAILRDNVVKLFGLPV
jgi:predicted TIM-barrel fold metal-dependent hydrolase